MKKISCVMMVDYFEKYIKASIDITSLFNHVYLIGPKKFQNLENRNISFVDIDNYADVSFAKKIEKNFVNYGAKDNKSEIFWLSRVPKLKEFMNEYKLENVFMIDADNILLFDINNYPFKNKNAICISPNWHKYHQSASIHSGLISKEFCDAYEKLYDDIFISKLKFHLIEGKVNFHKNNPGGIADMTLYYLLHNEKILNFDNLYNPVVINNQKSVFINNFSTSEGYKDRNQYMLKGRYLKIFKKNKNLYIYDQKENEYLKILNIHYQGKAKKKLNHLLKYKLQL